MKRVSELTGGELDAWQKDYPRREELRRKVGRTIIASFREVEHLSESKRRIAIASIAKEAKNDGVIAAVIEDILIKEFMRAAYANRDEKGANRDARVRAVNPEKITPELVDVWGNAFRINPELRESYLQESRDGIRKMVVALDKYNEPAGRVSLLYNGPIPHTDKRFHQSRKLAGKPTEKEVIRELGGGVPWIEDLAVLEGYRGGGIGIRLMLEVEDIVRRSTELPNITGLAVRPDNDVAVRMYEKLGYEHRKVAGQDTFVHHIEAVPPHETLLMVKQLY